jgi:hypothetical protein
MDGRVGKYLPKVSMVVYFIAWVSILVDAGLTCL